MLLEHGAVVNGRGHYGKTPLHFAVENGRTEVLRLLLDHGADANARDESDRTPSHWGHIWDIKR